MFSKKTSTYLSKQISYLYLASGRILGKEGDSITTYVLRTNSPKARRPCCIEKLLDCLYKLRALVAIEG